jgi:hypothetical protein
VVSGTSVSGALLSSMMIVSHPLATSLTNTGVPAEVPKVTPASAREGEGGFDAEVPVVGALCEASKTFLQD